MNVQMTVLSEAALAQVWQVTALAVVVLIVVRFFCKDRSHLAHALLLVVIIKCITPPIWSSPIGVFSHSWIPDQSRNISSLEGTGDDLGPSNSRPPSHNGVFVEQSDSSDIVSTVPPSTMQNPVTENTSVSTLFPAPLLLAVWAFGATIVGMLVVAKLLRDWRAVRKSISPASGMPLDLFNSTAIRLGLKQQARLFVSSEAFGPFSYGLLFPMVVLPRQLIQDASDEELQSILSHELIHVRRRDAIVATLQAVAGVVWWFHPLIWWGNRLLSRHREMCCDEQVLATTRCNPEHYANGIMSVLKLKKTSPPAFMASGIRPIDVTKARLEAIMSKRKNLSPRTPRACWVLFLLGLATTLPGATGVPQRLAASHAENETDEKDRVATVEDATPQGQSLKVTDEDIQKAIGELKKVGGQARIRGERTDPKHWVQIILEGSEFNDTTMDSVRLLSLDGRTHVHLRKTAVTFRGLEKLKGTQVVKLALSGELIDDKALSRVPDIESLEEIALESTSVTDEGLKHIADCRRLTSFSVADHPRVEGLEVVLAYLKELPDFTELRFHKNLNKLSVRLINELSKLDSLSVVLSSSDSNNAFDELQCLPSLKDLTVNADFVNDSTLQTIGLNATALEKLYIRGSGSITNGGLKSIGTLPKLQVLSLSRTAITDIEHLKPLKRLRWLDLMGTEVNDASLEVASNFPQLEHLMLVNTSVTEEGLQHLVGLENLSYVRLEGTYVKTLPEWMKKKEGLYATVDRNPYASRKSAEKNDTKHVNNDNSIAHRKDANGPESISLEKAVEAFNKKASRNPIGKFQEPLTVDEVVAAIRAWNTKSRPVDVETLKMYQGIADTQQLPNTAELDFTTGWRSGDYHFDVWWVDLTVMSGEKSGYGFRIRDRRIASRKTALRR